VQPCFVRLVYESKILSLPTFGLSCTTRKASPTNGLVNMWTSIALVYLVELYQSIWHFRYRNRSNLQDRESC